MSATIKLRLIHYLLNTTAVYPILAAEANAKRLWAEEEASFA